ncbi:hypothetical protein GCM10023194_61740 [Planotetraspora phitsanulokensis]|uniref:Sporulation protein YtfJ n=1 Tax=Planotetraspora phitsanulokensis TaxID=575192 RepID=A0A8J3UEM9_9ACTN|nr:spore germination protein GerW family protein [Planotetraspora phitsanulokensis]GII37605.1 hypothetical protein Pph01_26080 [Planotetraspora phitsanulokensis]
MEVTKLISRIQDHVTVRRVFGEPITVDGVTVVPVARVAAGGGGGEGSGPGVRGDGGSATGGDHTGEGQAEGLGAGFGMAASPAGVYVIKEGKVSWEPALDINRIVLGGQIVAVVALLTLRAIVRSRAKARAGAHGAPRRGR